ncbi:MAG TPA: isoleucine--tRNA ligase [Chloroflexota bacterium]|nr:isoleucine--tRNA ligase [Chloroflexota bacterium]
MFRAVDSKPDFPAMERATLEWWRETDAFKKLVARNEGKPRWSFIDGPITANNPMGVHHAWGRTYKDLYQRYHAMLGYEQRFQNGFDGQGLWIEVEVEKELGFTSKRDIEAFGVDKFVELCKARVRHYASVQTQQSIRLGYWMDWDNSYHTMSDENNYTIWLFLKRAHEKGLVYKGHDVMPWCPRCSTGLSDMEIVTEGYRELTHTSIFLKFPLLDRPSQSLLVWTTTPWTLAANVAAAVHPDLTYARVKDGDSSYWVSKDLADGEILEEVKGSALAGLRYTGPFDELPAQRGVEHRVVLWDEVSAEEGTGIVHIAPGCGREDFGLSKEYDLPVIAPIDEFGVFLDGYGDLTGKRASEVVDLVVQSLRARGILHRTQRYTHRYPVCWRCGTELLFRLVDEWFIAMDPIREDLMEITRQIRWIPEFGLDRELDWLRNMDDWMISKKRYYGLALPIYDCPRCGTFEVIGSEVELKERAVEGWDRFEGHSPHRPWIDAVKIACSGCGAAVSRIPDVGNAWLDAGIVPYSTLNYRHDRAYWERWFPADFITESFPGQFRNWFYSMLAQSCVLENRPPYRVCFGYALLKDEKGEDMHKSKGNAIPFDEAAERAGADVLRWMFLRCNPAANLLFGYGAANEVRRRLLTLWNVYAFFVTYARIDGFNPTMHDVDRVAYTSLDRWVLAKLNKLVADVRASLDDYDAMTACRDVEAFVDDLSNWYLRRGRRRYWKSEADADKTAAYVTLHRVLVTLAKLLAPFQPFLAEEMYQNLVRSVDPSAPESVHHNDYPAPDAALDDSRVLRDMEQVLRVVNLGRAARNKAALKVRQPLAKLLVHGVDPLEWEGLQGHVLDELNVKAIEMVDDPGQLADYEVKPVISKLGPKYGAKLREIQAELARVDGKRVVDGQPLVVAGVELLPDEVEVRTKDRPGLAVATEDGLTIAVDTTLTPELVLEGHARELVHRIQTMRKAADYQIDERIVTYYEGGPTLDRVVATFGDYVKQETLSRDLRPGVPETADHAEEFSIDGDKARIAVARG